MSQASRAVFVICLTGAWSSAQSQAPPTVSQVVTWSTLTTRTIQPAGGFTPTTTGTLKGTLLSVYTTGTPVDATSADFGNVINNPTNYNVANPSALSSAISSNIAVALSVIPISSPTSGVILKRDSATGAELPVSGTLGPIFTQRAETVGKGNIYIGFTHQSYHFTSLNGVNLNGMSVGYGGGDRSGITVNSAGVTTAPATINLGLDVRLSQDLAFLTFGLTNRMDVSVGLPFVHAAVASTAYNGIVYSGSGTDFNNGSKCWCVNTLTPGSFALSAPQIGSASLGKSGFGDMVLRFKGNVLERTGASLSAGVDLRLPTGDAANFLGTGTTSVKPFMALSLYSTPTAKGIIFAPHVELGWQFSGKSILGGTIVGTPTTAPLDGGGTVPVIGAPFTQTEGYVPDILSWGVGTEVALGRKNTIILDFLGNQIGMVHGAATLRSANISAPAPTVLPPGAEPMKSGLIDAGLTSFGQYSGAFGYKVRIAGNLIASFQALVRFDNNGLTARVVPLYGLGYSF
jgi:hypothetical protein